MAAHVRRWRAAAFLCAVVAVAGCRRGALGEDGGTIGDGGLGAIGGPGTGGIPGTGSIGGPGAGASGGPGAGGSGGPGGTGGSPVPAEASRAWTWSACGTIPGRAADSPQFVAAQFAPDDRLLAVSWSDGRVESYALPIEPLAPPRVLRAAGLPAPIGIAFSPDGSLLAELGNAGLTLRRVGDGSVVRQLDGPAAGCSGSTARFSPAGDLVLYDSCIWRIADGALLGHVPVLQATFRDDRIVGLGCAQGPGGQLEGVCTYDLAGNEISRQVLALDGEWLYPAQTALIAPRGDVVFWASDSRPPSGEPVTRLHAWDAADGRLKWTLPGDFWSEVRDGPAFSPGGDLVLFGSYRGTAVRRVADGTPVLAADNEIARQWPRALSAGGRLMLHDDSYGSSVLRETETGASLRVLGESAHYGEIRSLAISGDGGLLASVSNIALGWRVAPSFASSAAIWERGPAGPATVDVSPDGRLAALSGDVRTVFSAADGRVKFQRDVGNSEVPSTISSTCVTAQTRFSPDGRFFAGKGYTPKIEVFDTATFAQVASIPTESCSPGIAFSRDGRELATSQPSAFAVADWSPRWAAMPAGELTQEGIRRPPRVGVEFSPDGQRVLVTTCPAAFSGACQTAWWNGAPLPGLTARHPRVSAEGHWIVAGGTLLHDPSSEQRVLDAAATVGIFAPNGDVITGRGDGGLARFCRTR